MKADARLHSPITRLHLPIQRLWAKGSKHFEGILVAVVPVCLQRLHKQISVHAYQESRDWPVLRTAESNWNMGLSLGLIDISAAKMQTAPRSEGVHSWNTCLCPRTVSNSLLRKCWVILKMYPEETIYKMSPVLQLVFGTRATTKKPCLSLLGNTLLDTWHIPCLLLTPKYKENTKKMCLLSHELQWSKIMFSSSILGLFQ